jgi:hypothetical protein
MEVGFAVVVPGGEGGGEEEAVGECRVLEDENVLSKEPVGDGERDLERPDVCSLRRGMVGVCCLRCMLGTQVELRSNLMPWAAQHRFCRTRAGRNGYS